MLIFLLLSLFFNEYECSYRGNDDWFKAHNLNVTEATFAFVNTLLLFVGYPRSAHSLVGAILDAHPHMAVAHEFNLLSRFDRFASSHELFSGLFFNAERNDLELGGRMQSGYSYVIEGAWQGTYKAPLLAIGDKKGHGTTSFFEKDFDDASSRMRRLQYLYHGDVCIVHVLRNPYDNIATMIFYEFFVNSTGWQQMRIDAMLKPIEWRPEFTTIVTQYIKIALTNKRIDEYVTSCQQQFDERCVPHARIIHIDGAELLKRPIEVMQEWCLFLNVPFSQQWADASRKLLFAEPFPSRNLVVWPQDMVQKVHDELVSFAPFAKLVLNKPIHTSE